MRAYGPDLDGLECGNAAALDTRGTGWVVGFSDYLRGRPVLHVPKDRPAAGVCVKWFAHPAGDPNGRGKPVSTGRTFSVLAGGGRFVLRFWRPGRAAEVRTVELTAAGDFAAWGPGLCHAWEVPEPATVLTVRWEPAGSDGG